MEKLHNIYHNLILAVLLGSISCSSESQNLEHLSIQSAEEIVAVQYEKWENGEASFFELLAEDAVWTVTGKSPVSGTYYGKDDFFERAVNPINQKLKTPLKPELISLTSDSVHLWLHFKARAIDVNDSTYENTYVWKMQLRDKKIINGIAFLDTYELTNLMNTKAKTVNQTIEETKAYIGMWVTKDGQIRHELLPNNRYDEARGNRKSAYQGNYKVTGNHIDYKEQVLMRTESS